VTAHDVPATDPTPDFTRHAATDRTMMRPGLSARCRRLIASSSFL